MSINARNPCSVIYFFQVFNFNSGQYITTRAAIQSAREIFQATTLCKNVGQTFNYFRTISNILKTQLIDLFDNRIRMIATELQSIEF